MPAAYEKGSLCGGLNSVFLPDENAPTIFTSPMVSREISYDTLSHPQPDHCEGARGPCRPHKERKDTGEDVCFP